MGEMEMESIEAVLERIWDLHDKISGAIHAISRAHFLKSIKNLTGPSPEDKHLLDGDVLGGDGEGKCGYVFVKGFRADEDASIAEVRSLNAIRSALENLEDQMEFIHTIQCQQQAERNAATLRLDQSRMILAMRLAEHQGEKHKVIEEAQTLVSDVQDASRFIAPESLFVGPTSRPFETSGAQKYVFMQMLFSSLSFAKKSLGMDRLAGVLGNAAIFSLSMLALIQMHRGGVKSNAFDYNSSKNERMAASKEGCSDQLNVLQYLDVYSARG